MDDAIFRFTEDDWVVPELRDFFSSAQTRQRVDEIAARFSLSPSHAQRLAIGIRDVVRGKMTDEDLADALVKDAVLPYETALDLQADVFADVLSDVGGLLEEQRGIYVDLHPEDNLPVAAPEKDMTEAVAKETVAKSGLAPADAVQSRRLEAIVVSRIKDVRDEAETKAMLEKPTKTGGMGMTPEQSAQMLLFMTEAMPKVAAAKASAAEQEKARAEQEKIAVERRQKKVAELSARLGAATRGPAAAPAAEVLPETSKETKSDLALEDETDKEKKEIEKIEEKAEKKQTFEETVRSSSSLDVAVDDSVAASGVVPADDDLKRRYRMLVSLYFRDLRDYLETKSKFTMPTVSGGMGLADEEAERVMALLKEKSVAFHAGAYDKAAAEKAKYVEEQKTKVLTESMNDQQKEQDTLEKAYANVLRRGGVTPPPPPPMTGGQPKIIPVVAAGRPAAPAEPPGALPTPVPVRSAAPPAPTAAPKPSAPAAPPAASPATMPAPAPPPSPAAVPAPAPAQPAAVRPAGQDTVSDVKFTPRLTGPVEELRQLTVKDFRRLSKDPREATLKLKDKIDLLDDLGFEVKTEGIKAWQDSETNKLYLSMLRTSLEGRPINDVIAELERKNQPVLNKQEFDAVMELNRKLRFG